MRTCPRFQRLSCWVVSAALLLSCAVPVQGAEPPLTEVEQREILTALEELAISREEIRQLRAVVAKDAEQIAALQTESRDLRAAIQALDPHNYRSLDFR